MDTARAKLSELDLWIRQGRSLEARAWLEARFDEFFGSRKPEDSETLTRLGGLFRRVGRSDLSIRLLHSRIRSESRRAPRGSPSERAEYAAALSQVGASQEALELLGGVDASTVPQALLYAAFARITLWDYEGAIPLLDRYVAQGSRAGTGAAAGIGDYERVVGSVNLAASLVACERWERVEPLLEDLLRETREQELLLLEGALLGLSLQMLVLQRRFSDASAILGEAKGRMSGVASLDALYLAKWEQVLALERDPSDAGAEAELVRVREQARLSANWETVRDCDFHLGRLLGRSELLRRAYFGTPYESYRHRVREALGSGQLGSDFVWDPSGNSVGAPELDLLTATFDRGPRRKIDVLSPGQVPHRLLLALTSDFYRPARLAALHAEVFPGNHFNPQSSPLRVRQALLRLRKAFRSAQVPLQIRYGRSTYRLLATKPVALRVRDREARDSRELGLSHAALARTELLRARMGSASHISASQAAAIWGVSKRSAHATLTEGLEQGIFEREGSGPTTRYRLK